MLTRWMLLVNDVSATSNESCRADFLWCYHSGRIPYILRSASPSPFFPHRLLTFNGLFRNIARGISFEPLFVLPLPLLPSFSAIPLCRNLVKTVSDWVDRRLSIPLSSNWFLPFRPASSFYEPHRIAKLTTCARIGLFGFKVPWACKGTHEWNCWVRFHFSQMNETHRH